MTRGSEDGGKAATTMPTANTAATAAALEKYFVGPGEYDPDEDLTRRPAGCDESVRSLDSLRKLRA